MEHTPGMQLFPSGVIPVGGSLVLGDQERKTVEIFRRDVQKLKRKPEHEHRAITEFFFVLAGSIIVQVNGVDHQVHQGGIMRIPPNVMHDLHTCTPDLDLIVLMQDFNKADMAVPGDDLSMIVYPPEHEIWRQ